MKIHARQGALIALMIVAVAAVPKAAERFHFGLSRSVPAADAVVPAPEQIHLWFTQVPRDGSLSVRLIDSGGEAVETSEPEAHADDAKAFAIRIAEPLAGGSYSVAWRGIGDDGHVVRSEFGFRVSTEGVLLDAGGRTP